MRFTKSKEKYSDKIYWAAISKWADDYFYIICPNGAGFNLYRRRGWGRSKEIICRVNKFDSAKKIANLIDNG